MVRSQNCDVKSLSLDLKNYRTTHQKDESSALEAIITIDPDHFWGLMDSILQDGYLSNENIIILDVESDRVVKEGNRRVGALKIIAGYIKVEIKIPDQLQSKIAALKPKEIKALTNIPCVVYNASDKVLVEKLVSRIHGKAEKSGRARWTAMARARHNRDNGNSEYGLNLVEKFLNEGKNISDKNKILWSGEYSVTVVDELLKRLSSYFGFDTSKDVSSKYPEISKRDILESMLYDIGQEKLGFKDLRENLIKTIQKYGLQADVSTSESTDVDNKSVQAPSNINEMGSGDQDGSDTTTGAADTLSPVASQNTLGTKETKTNTQTEPSVPATDNPESVKAYLNSLSIRGSGKNKAETIKTEMTNLKIQKNPLAFCLLLRSFLEVLMKAFIDERPELGLMTVKDGRDIELLNMIRKTVEKIAPKVLPTDADVTAIKDAKRIKNRRMQSVMMTLGNEHGILSITAMNSLVHSSHFTIPVQDLCREFHNITPLLNELVEPAIVSTT